MDLAHVQALLDEPEEWPSEINDGKGTFYQVKLHNKTIGGANGRKTEASFYMSEQALEMAFIEKLIDHLEQKHYPENRYSLDIIDCSFKIPRKQKSPHAILEGDSYGYDKMVSFAAKDVEILVVQNVSSLLFILSLSLAYHFNRNQQSGFVRTTIPIKEETVTVRKGIKGQRKVKKGVRKGIKALVIFQKMKKYAKHS
jgi:hypothetical protein